jgi:hypothetical protein
MKTQSFVLFLTLSVDADAKEQENLRKKAVTVSRLLAQTLDHKIFHYKFLLKSLDNVCISTFVNVNLF